MYRRQIDLLFEASQKLSELIISICGPDKSDEVKGAIEDELIQRFQHECQSLNGRFSCNEKTCQCAFDDNSVVELILDEDYTLRLKAENPKALLLYKNYLEFFNLWDFPKVIRKLCKTKKASAEIVDRIKNWETNLSDVPLRRGLPVKVRIKRMKRKKATNCQIDIDELLDALYNRAYIDYDLKRNPRLWIEKEERYSDVENRAKRICRELKSRLARYRVNPFPKGVVRAIVDNHAVLFPGAPNPEDEPLLLYADTMGWLVYPDGSVEIFEDSDEPTELDLKYRRTFTISPDYITLWTMQTKDFVDTWDTEGIPPDTYFTSEKWIAERYWHPEGNDVSVQVLLPFEALVETADAEYKTIRTIKPGEFKIL